MEKKDIFAMENSDFEEESISSEDNDYNKKDYKKILEDLDSDSEEELPEDKKKEIEEEDKKLTELNKKGSGIKKLLDQQQTLNISILQSMRLVNKMNIFPQKSDLLNFRKKNLNEYKSTKYNMLLLLQDLFNLQNSLATKYKKNFSGTSEAKEILENVMFSSFKFEAKANDITKLKNKNTLNHVQTAIDGSNDDIKNNYKQKINRYYSDCKKNNDGLEKLKKSPFDAAEELIKFDDEIEKVFQTKNVNYLILGKKIDENNDDYCDPEIYEDNRLVEEFHKDINFFDKNFGDEVREGLVYKNTEKFLLNRKKKIKKLFNNRASKGRRLKYTVFTQLENFKNSEINDFVIENREDLIKNLFNKNKLDLSESNIGGETTDDIELI